jgi:hypothetical protein
LIYLFPDNKYVVKRKEIVPFKEAILVVIKVYVRKVKWCPKECVPLVRTWSELRDEVPKKIF